MIPKRKILAAIAILCLFNLSLSTLLAKKRFRRVYPRSRTVTIRHQGRVKKVPTNTYYAAYTEETYRLLPNWQKRTIENNRGIKYVWKVRDRNKDKSLTPAGVRVSPRRPYPNDVEPIRVNDFEDNFHGRR